LKINIDILLNLTINSSAYFNSFYVNIIPVIRDLLLRNQKAVIPGFGAFVLAQRPAQLNKVTRVLTPPSLTVRFDRHQHSDDGQLAGYLTRKLKLTSEVVRQAIADFTGSLEEKLRDDGSVVLEGLGTLSKKKTGDLGFVPEDELLKRISLFEMPKIDIPGPPAVDKTFVPPPVTPTELPVATYSSRKRWVLPVILLGLLCGMLLVIYLTGNMGILISDIKSKFDGSKAESTEQLVFGNDADDEQKPEVDSLVDQVSRKLDEQVDRENALAYKETRQETTTPVSTPPAQTVLPATQTYAKPFHIIAGSFTVVQNAEKLKASLKEKGLTAEILPRDGRFYMVSLGSYNTADEASNAQIIMEQTLRKELWVMRRKQ